MNGSNVRRTNFRRVNSNDFVFSGFPGVFAGSENVLKQICIILNLWNLKNCFPIHFEQINMGS